MSTSQEDMIAWVVGQVQEAGDDGKSFTIFYMHGLLSALQAYAIRLSLERYALVWQIALLVLGPIRGAFWFSGRMLLFSNEGQTGHVTCDHSARFQVCETKMLMGVCHRNTCVRSISEVRPCF